MNVWSFELQELRSWPKKRQKGLFGLVSSSASVFAHEVKTDDGKRTMRSVSVQKRYLDGEDVKYSSSFSLAELPQAIRVLQLALDYVESQEAEVPLS